MRIDEIASAEEQLALWKLVSDNVWSAIAAQAEQERRAKAEKAARSKPKSSTRRSSPKAAKPIAPPLHAKPATANATKDAKPQATNAQPTVPQQQVQPKVYGATGVQPRAPIAPIPPVATSAAVQSTPQALAKHPKPKITARAGGLTV